jgi:hypothetical protein
MDFRFQKSVQTWLKERGYLGSCDEVIVAGASRDIVKPIEPAHKDYLMRQIDLSVKLHNPDEIVIIDHQDCGGYAQDETIRSGLETQEDRDSHCKYASEAKVILKEKYPKKEIKTFYAKLGGGVEEI